MVRAPKPKYGIASLPEEFYVGQRVVFVYDGTRFEGTIKEPGDRVVKMQIDGSNVGLYDVKSLRKWMKAA